jgi:hypothetical protein
MLPFDNRPWARRVARVVICGSVAGAVAGGWYMYSVGELHIPEVTILVLLLLAIVPPNVAVLRKRPEAVDGAPARPVAVLKEDHLHVR